MRKSYRDGKHYRERAEECRVLAELFLEPALRAKMLKVANDYERMGVDADNIVREVRELKLAFNLHELPRAMRSVRDHRRQ